MLVMQCKFLLMYRTSFRLRNFITWASSMTGPAKCKFGSALYIYYFFFTLQIIFRKNLQYSLIHDSFQINLVYNYYFRVVKWTLVPNYYRPNIMPVSTLWQLCLMPMIIKYWFAFVIFRMKCQFFSYVRFK